MSQMEFLSTPSARRATQAGCLRPPAEAISIHALREEGDGFARRRKHDPKDFYPRPPRGGRRTKRWKNSGGGKFLSTPSARRATHRPSVRRPSPANFYPRPPRGGRHLSPCGARPTVQFLSTPSARRATKSYSGSFPFIEISIHALREEGDFCNLQHHVIQLNFYPRPPRGGRPGPNYCHFPSNEISIHALREEGDARRLGSAAQATYFYPRPPRGGRHRTTG